MKTKLDFGYVWQLFQEQIRKSGRYANDPNYLRIIQVASGSCMQADRQKFCAKNMQMDLQKFVTFCPLGSLDDALCRIVHGIKGCFLPPFANLPFTFFVPL